MSNSKSFEKPFVVMGVGVPGSGKTTRLLSFAEEVGAEYLSADRIRAELTGDEASQRVNSEAWNELRSRAAGHLAEGRSIVVDATHAKAHERRRATGQYREMGARSVLALWFDIDPSAAIERIEQRVTSGGRGVPSYAVHNMHRFIQHEPPQESDGFDTVVRILHDPQRT